MSYQHVLYVCPICNKAYCHRLIYCVNCPGKLEQKRFLYHEIDWNKPGAGDKWRKWLSDLGLQDGGL